LASWQGGTGIFIFISNNNRRAAGGRSARRTLHQRLRRPSGGVGVGAHADAKGPTGDTQRHHGHVGTTTRGASSGLCVPVRGLWSSYERDGPLLLKTPLNKPAQISRQVLHFSNILQKLVRHSFMSLPTVSGINSLDRLSMIKKYSFRLFVT